MPVQSPLLKSTKGLSQSNGVKYGDVDGSGTVTATDALMAQKAFLGQIELTDRQKRAADVNGDGMVNATDALLIEKYALGEIDKFPVEKEEREPQKIRNLRADIATLQTNIAKLRPFDELPPWRRKRLVKATNLADEANILVEDEDQFSEAQMKYDEALRIFKDDAPPESGTGNGGSSTGGSSNGDPSNEGGSGGDGSGGASGGSDQMISGVDDTTLVLGAGVAATGLIALAAS